MSADPVNYVLIDYENVQPKDLDRLKDGPFRVKIFLGPNQARIPVDLADTVQQFGSNANYVRVEGTKPNALDFHIAFYVGELSCQEPSAFFHIISKDTGFDPLIKHLKGKRRSVRVRVQRAACIADMACFKPALPPTIEAQAEAAISNLIGRNSSKPATMKALRGTLRTLFKKKASEDQLSKLIDHLRAQGIVKEDGKKLSYKLPTLPA